MLQHPVTPTEVQTTLETMSPDLMEEYLPGAIEAHIVTGVGLDLDTETRWILRTIVRASLDTKRVHEVAHRLGMSRRALNRHFYARGLPVASHWLQACRLARAAILLRGPDAPTAEAVAWRLAYPDPGCFSHTMLRYTGLRPGQVRGLPRWQDVIDAWIETEILANVVPAGFTTH